MDTKQTTGFAKLLGGLALLCLSANGCDGTAGDGAVNACSAADPKTLVCTGLYGSGQAIAGDVLEYAPAESLWADGAVKRRFIRLPPGSKIDSRDMDEWVFPVGTQTWKEFTVAGRKVETRYAEKRTDGSWLRTTYVWSDDETSAVEVTAGVQNVRGTGYDVPPQTECNECHDGAADGVLGFEAIGLSGAAATGLTMQALIDQGLLTQPPAQVPVIPGGPLDVAALGWLHANCGNACHNGTSGAAAGWTGLHMRLTVGALATVQDTDTYKTALGVASSFQPTPDAGFLRIAPGDPAHSAIPFRASARNAGGHAGWQMPPIATNVADLADVDAVEAWITSL